MKASLSKGMAIIGVLAVFMLVNQELKATTSALTGSCAAMMSLKPITEVEYGVWDNQPTPGSSSQSTGAVDAMVLINFDESKIYINATKATVETSIDANMYWYRTKVSYLTQTLTPIALTMSDGPLPGSYLLVAPANTIPSLVLMPVNSGNTFLIQAKDGKATGLCQKV